VASEIATRIRAAFTENLNLKILSFVFALVLYSLVHGSQDAQRTITVNVDVLVPPDSANRVLVTPLPPVHVTLRGPRAVIDDLHADDVGSVQVDIRSGNETRVVFDPSMVHVPPGVRVEQIAPSESPIAWEDVIVRDVPVQVSVVGTPATGFVVKGEPVAEPATIRARGPKSDVMVIQHARAEGFVVNGLTEGKYTRQLSIDRAQSSRVRYEMSAVTVSVDIAREVVERPFTKVPVAVVGQPKARTQPAEVDVRLSCPPEIVRALRPEQIVPRVHINPGPDHGSELLPVELSVDRCNAQITPASVIVRW
jgi:YbbR domain-containing protein